MRQIGMVQLSGDRAGTVYYGWRPESDHASHTLQIDVVHDTSAPINSEDQLRILAVVEDALRDIPKS